MEHGLVQYTLNTVLYAKYRVVIYLSFVVLDIAEWLVYFGPPYMIDAFFGPRNWFPTATNVGTLLLLLLLTERQSRMTDRKAGTQNQVFPIDCDRRPYNSVTVLHCDD